MQLLRNAARQGRDNGAVFSTKTWAGYVETGAAMALELDGNFILVPSRAALP
jgi:hypothetical protein